MAAITPQQVSAAQYICVTGSIALLRSDIIISRYAPPSLEFPGRTSPPENKYLTPGVEYPSRTTRSPPVPAAKHVF